MAGADCRASKAAQQFRFWDSKRVPAGRQAARVSYGGNRSGWRSYGRLGEIVIGEAALQVMRKRETDLALVDVMLPGLDGFEVVRQARIFTDIPILLVTARREEAQPGRRARVGGRRLCRQAVLGSRGRGQGPGPPAAPQQRRRRDEPLHLGALQIDPTARRCMLDGREIDLTRREFDLLLALAEQPGLVLTRTQLLDAAWGTTYVGEKTVDVHLASLRRKLGDSLKVSAVRGVGYRLEP